MVNLCLEVKFIKIQNERKLNFFLVLIRILQLNSKEWVVKENMIKAVFF